MFRFFELRCILEEMNEEITKSDLDLILESLEYSKRNVRESPDSPPEIKKEKLEQIDLVASKIRKLKTEI
jgi:hypothetical protein